MIVEQGEPIRGKYGKPEPVGAGWVYGCAVCRGRPQSLAICFCACGSDHSLCFPCLTAMSDLGMAEERIEEHVEEENLGAIACRKKVTVNLHDLTRCPGDECVRAAVLLARR